MRYVRPLVWTRNIKKILSKIKKADICLLFLFGRGDRDRTCDLMVPNHARSHLRHTPIIILYSFILPHLSATKIILHDDFKSVNTFFKFFLFFLFYTSFMYKIGSLSSIKSIYPIVLLGLLIPKETLPGFINIIPSPSSIIGICE